MEHSHRSSKMEMSVKSPYMGRKGDDEELTFFFFVRCFCFFLQIHSFEQGRGRNGCWPCVRNQSLHTPARERRGGKGGKKRKKERSDTNAPYEKNRLDQQLVGRVGGVWGGAGVVEREGGFGGSEGKPFHQVLEIQAAGS